MKKARHGENIYKRKDGRYEGRYVIGKTITGKTCFGYVYGCQYAAVKKELLLKKADHARTVPAANGICQSTVGEWIDNANSSNFYFIRDVGGAVYVENGTATMQGGTIKNCGSVHQASEKNGQFENGGAFYVIGGDFIMTGGTLEIGLNNCGGKEDQSMHTNRGAGRHHPILTGNEADVRGGGIAIANEGVVHFYCGSAISNSALSAGVGKNVFMAGGEFNYYDGTNIGVPRAPDLVIVGGTLNNRCEEEDYIHLYYYDTNNPAVGAGPDLQGLAQAGEDMNLPDAQFFFTAPSDKVRFVGWTAKGTGNVGTGEEYVRSKDQYAPSGTVTLTVPATMGNEYMGRIGIVPWTFLVEEIPEDDTPDTGDWFQTTLWISIAAVLAAAIVMLLIVQRKRRAENN